ncbi:kinase-like protein [Neofusicoccum parvum]|uniref:Kinase-like protein n=1 Tax=Neofusicoccum parvum TaxID=310453 RepID=A0ACB5S4H0_9PEZI|nr:kinase-like protein [Neofusicoccum parvum]
MVVGRAPDVAPTAATVANLAGLQQNNVLQGRDLFREAFQHRYENDKRNDEYWTKHLDRTYGKTDAERERWFNKKAVLPEPFLWYVFHCMAEAILFMESGVTDPTQPDDPAWVQADSPMIQTDMKPANILLDTPETTQSWVRIYPKPLLADFGGVLRLSNAHTIRGQGGTWGFTPFEMMGPMEQRIANENRRKGPLRRAVPARGEPFAAPIAEVSAIGSAASVYELGATMHNLLTLDAPQQLGDAGNAKLAVPPYWSEQPRHMARRPWPWRGASRLARKDWGEQLERGHARPFAPRLLADGSLVEMEVPKELDGRGRSRGQWRMIDGESVWYPYSPVGAVKPAYSDRLIELGRDGRYRAAVSNSTAGRHPRE